MTSQEETNIGPRTRGDAPQADEAPLANGLRGRGEDALTRA